MEYVKILFILLMKISFPFFTINTNLFISLPSQPSYEYKSLVLVLVPLGTDKPNYDVILKTRQLN